jgi:uncharacterized protein (DUF885 family)
MTTRRRLLWLLGAGAVSWRAGARDEAAGERVQHAQGDRFDLRAFHEQFLSYGSAPVAVIAALMSPGASSP